MLVYWYIGIDIIGNGIGILVYWYWYLYYYYYWYYYWIGILVLLVLVFIAIPSEDARWMLDRCSTEMLQSFDVSSIVVRSIFYGCCIDVRYMCDRCSIGCPIGVRLMFDSCSMDTRCKNCRYGRVGSDRVRSLVIVPPFFDVSLLANVFLVVFVFPTRSFPCRGRRVGSIPDGGCDDSGV